MADITTAVSHTISEESSPRPLEQAGGDGTKGAFEDSNTDQNNHSTAMCTDYELNVLVKPILEEASSFSGCLPIVWAGGSIATAGAESHIRIGDKGIVVRLRGDHLRAESLPWSWEERGHPLYNLSIENRSFGNSDRCLILATGFYEYTRPPEPKGKWQDQHLVKLRGYQWFWIAGVVKHNAFTVLTTMLCPQTRRRQICILRPSEGLAWLEHLSPTSTLLKDTAPIFLQSVTLRKDCLFMSFPQARPA